MLFRSVHITSDGLPMVKTLGVTWLPGEDVFTFNANPPEKDFPLTKRNFLKEIAKLFDPVGFLAPFIIRPKILLQEMWAAGMDWDDLFLGDLASKRVNGSSSWKICLPLKLHDVYA